jgi:hypothetical protein
MQTAGPSRAAQSVSAVHGPQVFVVAEQTGVALGQSELPTHCTQAPLVAQTGCVGKRPAQVVPVGAEEQATHTPAPAVAPAQNGLVPSEQSSSVWHSSHAPPAPQMDLSGFCVAQKLIGDGVACAQDAHVPPLEQNGWARSWQSLAVTQATHAPVAPQRGWFASRAPHAPCAACMQDTQLPVVEQNDCVESGQSMSVLQTPQAPPVQ